MGVPLPAPRAKFSLHLQLLIDFEKLRIVRIKIWSVHYMGTTITISRLLLSYLQLTEIEIQKFQVTCRPALRAYDAVLYFSQ